MKHLTLLTLSSFLIGIFYTPVTIAKEETVFLMLHGLGSGPETFDNLARYIDSAPRREGFACSNIEYSDIGQAASLSDKPCYRWDFSDKTAYEFGDATIGKSHFWENGDGLTYPELGTEVGLAVELIKQKHAPILKNIVLVGHSRGTLSARAYLQAIAPPGPGDIQFGLISVGGPHQGSSLGRICHYMRLHDYHIDGTNLGPDGTQYDPPVLVDSIFSPSVCAFGVSYDRSGDPCNGPDDPSVSQAICTLNRNTPNQMTGKLNQFAMVNGHYLDTPISLVFLANDLRLLLAGDEEQQALKEYMVQGQADLPRNWRKGDGVVPYSSQLLTNIWPAGESLPGYLGTKTLFFTFHTLEAKTRSGKQAIWNFMKNMEENLGS